MNTLETKIDNDWLDKFRACEDGREWLDANTGIGATAANILADLRSQKEWSHFRWLAARLMTHAQKVEWAIFCAEQVLPIFEKRRPNEQRPRKAIEAAKGWLVDPSPKNKRAAAAAAAAADAAAAAVAAADDAAAAAADAAADAAAAAAVAAVADAAAAAAADAAAAVADADARNKMRNICADKATEILSQNTNT